MNGYVFLQGAASAVPPSDNELFASPVTEDDEGATLTVLVVVEGILVTTALVLVCILFATAYVAVPTYAISPENAGCRAWVEGECLSVDPPSWGALAGTVPVAERRALGLFSEMNSAIIALCAQALATALSVGLLSHLSRWATTLPEQKEDAHWFFRKAGLTLLLACAVLLLVMQDAWAIPQNHLLWLELLLGAGVMVLWRVRNANWWMTGLVVNAFAMPALCVASLSAAGEPDTETLLLTYGGLCGLPLVLLGGASERTDSPWPMGNTVVVLAVPFTVFASLRLNAPLEPAGWATAALALSLAWVLGTMLTLASAFAVAKDTTTELLGRVFTWAQLVATGAVSLTLLGGQVASA